MARGIEPISRPMPGVAISCLLEYLLLDSGCHAVEKAQKAQWRGPAGKKLRRLITAPVSFPANQQSAPTCQPCEQVTLETDPEAPAELSQLTPHGTKTSSV